MGQTSSRAGRAAASPGNHPNHHQLPYKHALITGASSGIGAAVALRLATTTPGITLTLVARNASRLNAVGGACRASGAHAELLLADVADQAAMAAALLGGPGEASRPPIDLVIANAGTAVAATPRSKEGGDDLPAALWTAANTNIMGTLNTITPLLPQLKAAAAAGRPAAVAIMSSVSALPPKSVQFTGQLQLGVLPYAWTKQSLLLLGEGLRAELAGSGVSVFTLCPGVVMTDLAVNLALNLQQAATVAGSVQGASAAAAGSSGGGTAIPGVAFASLRAAATKPGSAQPANEKLLVQTDVASSDDAAEDTEEGGAASAATSSLAGSGEVSLPAAATAASAAAMPAVPAAGSRAASSAEDELRQRLNAISAAEAAEFICRGLATPPKQDGGVVAFPAAAVRVMRVLSLLPQRLLVKAIKKRL